MKSVYKLGDKIYKYDYENNSIEELMIDNIEEYGSYTTLGNKIESFTMVYYRLANKFTSNQYSDIQESKINKTYFFSSKELLIKKLKDNLESINILK